MNNATTQCKIHRAIACWLEIHHANVTIDDIQCNDNAIVHLKHHYDIATGCDLDMSLVGKLESWNLRHRVHQQHENVTTRLTASATVEPGDTHRTNAPDALVDQTAAHTATHAAHFPTSPTPAPVEDDSGSSWFSAGAGLAIGLSCVALAAGVVIYTRQAKLRKQAQVQAELDNDGRQIVSADADTGSIQKKKQSLLLRDIRF